MRADPIPLPGDWDEPPFSNGTMGEIWTWNVCGAGDGCVHDSTYGQHIGPTEAQCPLITLSFFGTWPQEWERRTVTTSHGSYETPGACSEFSEVPVDADPVVAVDLFGRFNTEPRVEP